MRLLLILNILCVLGIKFELRQIFKNGPGEICGRHPLKDLKLCGLLKHLDLEY